MRSRHSWCSGVAPLRVSSSSLDKWTGVISARFSLSMTRSTLDSARGNCSAFALRTLASHPALPANANWDCRKARVRSRKMYSTPRRSTRENSFAISWDR